MLTNPGTPFTEEGFASVVADLRRLFLLVGGGSNDLNNASSDVTQDGVSGGENANNAFKLRNVNISTTAPTNGQVLVFSTATKQYGPSGLSGVASSSTGTALISTNNLSDLTNSATAANNLDLGTNDAVTFASVATTSGVAAGGALTVGSGATISKDLQVSSGVLFQGGLRLSTTLMNSSAAISTSASYILTSGAITITLPSAATHRVYFIGCDTGAASTVSALDGTQNIRGATGVSLVQGRIHTFMSDGSVTWFETRSA